MLRVSLLACLILSMLAISPSPATAEHPGSVCWRSDTDCEKLKLDNKWHTAYIYANDRVAERWEGQCPVDRVASNYYIRYRANNNNVDISYIETKNRTRDVDIASSVFQGDIWSAGPYYYYDYAAKLGYGEQSRLNNVDLNKLQAWNVNWPSNGILALDFRVQQSGGSSYGCRMQHTIFLHN